MRRAAKVDANQAAIVAALRQIGAKAYYIKEPVDLLVGFRGVNYLLEVKNPDGKDTPTALQIEFIDGWPAPVHVVRNVSEAMSAIIGKGAMA